ncbi:ROST-like protein [Mya arenaria]|uniref:ROST-like protein n=1 Tax=Mya arenaria TaxID=6604 RepID=A0ABY7FY52_MYAAR|nr:uncharacterized protein LOC128217864 [Mya arenaria]XP_052781771.1 uncharacterized protein LOC128218212 [Mya arenaria]WAR26234.1 ROST-like protein [Mya arenaria]WAR26309.1 ROST-like protein [Mya arenaria]
MERKIKDEFRLRKFGFSHFSADSLVLSQWDIPAPVYVVYRVLVSAYCVFAFTQLFVTAQDPNHRLMAYLTVWTYLLLTIYFVSSLLVTLYRTYIGRGRRQSVSETVSFARQTDANVNAVTQNGYRNPAFNDTEKQSRAVVASSASFQNGKINNISVETSVSTLNEVDATVWYMKITWLIGDCVYVFAPVVTVVYFGALYPAIGHTNYVDVNVHGVNSVFVFIDAFMVARPVRLLHAIYPVFYGLCYLIFSIIYWSADKVNNVLYKNVLDWNQPGLTVGVVAGLTFIVIPLLQLLHYGIYRLRLIMYRRLYGREFND